MSHTDHHLSMRRRRQARNLDQVQERRERDVPQCQRLLERTLDLDMRQQMLATTIDQNEVAQNLGQYHAVSTWDLTGEHVHYERDVIPEDIEAFYDQPPPYADWECELLGLPQGTQHSTESHDRNSEQHLRICEDCSRSWAQQERQDIAEFGSTGDTEPEDEDTEWYDALPLVSWDEMAEVLHLLPGEMPVFVGPTMTQHRLHPAGPGAIVAYELARFVGVTTSDLIAHMRSHGEHVQNANSLIPRPVADAYWGHVWRSSIESMFHPV